MTNATQTSSSTPWQEYLGRRGLVERPLHVALEASISLLKSGCKAKPYLMSDAGIGKTEGTKYVIAPAMDAFYVGIVGGFATADQERGVPIIKETIDSITDTKTYSFSPAARDLLADPMNELRETGKIVRGDEEYTSMLLFFDELNQADSEVLKIFFSAFTSDNLPGLDWSDLPVYVMAAGNPPINGYQVKKIHLSEAWDRRLCTIPVAKSTYKTWRKWAKTAGVDSTVLQYLKQKPTILHKDRAGAAKEEKVATPATWKSVSDYIQSGVDLNKPYVGAAIEGMLGHLVGLDFVLFLKNGAQDSMDTQQLLHEPWDDVEEYLEALLKEGSLGRVATAIQNLTSDLLDELPTNVVEVATRVTLILNTIPRDTRAIYGRVLEEEEKSSTETRKHKWIGELDRACRTGPLKSTYIKIVTAQGKIRRGN
jgi:hypothetical protein